MFLLAQYRPVGGRLSNQEMRTCHSSKINPGACSLHQRNTICAWNNSNIDIKQRTLGKRIYRTDVFFSNYLHDPKHITPKFYPHYIQPRPPTFYNTLTRSPRKHDLDLKIQTYFHRCYAMSHTSIPNRQLINCQ